MFPSILVVANLLSCDPPILPLLFGGLKVVRNQAVAVANFAHQPQHGHLPPPIAQQHRGTLGPEVFLGENILRLAYEVHIWYMIQLLYIYIYHTYGYIIIYNVRSKHADFSLGSCHSGSSGSQTL